MERTGKAKKHYERATEFLINRKCERAIAEYTEVIKLIPDDVESYDKRSACYENLKQLDKALADIDKAITLEPEKSNYYFRRAGIYIALGEMEKIASDIEKAVEIKPDQAGRLYVVFAERIKKLAENKSEAAVYYKKSIEHGDFKGLAKKALDSMEM